MSCSDIFLGVIAILFPPLAVWVKTGLCSADSCINILLCMLGFIPGLLHAWYIIAKYPEHDYDRIDGDEEGQQRVTYYYISHEPGRRGRRNQQRQGPQYGAIPAVPGNKPLPQGPSRQQPQQQTGVVRTDNAAGSSRPSAPSAGASGSGAGSDEQGAPPPYNEVVRGDHKIQRQD